MGPDPAVAAAFRPVLAAAKAPAQLDTPFELHRAITATYKCGVIAEDDVILMVAPLDYGPAQPRVTEDPLGWYAMHSFRRPRMMFTAAWSIVLILCAVSFPFFDLSPEGDYDWLLGGNALVSRSYALKRVQEETSLYTELAERSVKQNEQLIHFMYEAKTASGSVLAPALIKEMLSVEMTFFAAERFAAFCVADIANVSKCSPGGAQSIVNLFYDAEVSRDINHGNKTAYSVTPITDASTGTPYVDTQEGVDKRLAAILANTASFPDARLLFDTSFSANNLKAKYVQSFYFLGMPLAGYSNPADRNEDQRRRGDAFIVDVSASLQRRFGLKDTFLKSTFQTSSVADTVDGGVKVYWWSQPMEANEWAVLTAKDLNWTIMSFIGVGGYIAYHTGSLIISLNSMCMTLFSIFVAFFFFRIVFQITFFSFINFLIIFVVLGVGADDVFVFMDAFQQSLYELKADQQPATLEFRMKHTMKRALHAIFVTSFTTSVAFLATSLSPLVPLKSFGIFSALVIICVFCVNALILPPLVVMYARNFMGRGWIESFKAFTCGLLPTAPYVDPGRELTTPGDHGEAPPSPSNPRPSFSARTSLRRANSLGNGGTGLKRLPSKIRPGDEKYDTDSMRITERFFYMRYYHFLRGRAKYVILVSFTALFAVGVILWVKLEVPAEPEQWFPESHMFSQYQDLASRKVMVGGDSASTLSVNIMWGVDGVDSTGTNPWDPSDLGVVKYDEDFNLAAADAQAWIMQTYEKLKDAPCTVKACSSGLLVDPAEPIRNVLAETDSSGNLTGGFYLWLRTQGIPGAHPTTAPVTGDAFNAKMCAYSELRVTKLRYPGHVGYLSNRCDDTPPPQSRFILIEAKSSIRMPQAPVDFVAAQDQWEDFSVGSNRGAPSTLTGAKAASTNPFWLWSITSLSLKDNVYLGQTVCFPMVFFVLTLSTGNVILALYSTMTIAGIAASVIGIGVGGIMGWDLGTTESISSVIVIGFSVDYCVHLANAYIENDATHREVRTRIALTTMGISVTAGAITTIIGGAFLSLCILTFFVKFSFLVCFTIICSYIWAVVFFGALCMTAGPSGKFGDIRHIWQKVRRFFARWCSSSAH